MRIDSTFFISETLKNKQHTGVPHLCSWSTELRGTRKKSPEELTAIAEHLLGSIIISVGGIGLTRDQMELSICVAISSNEGHSHRPLAHIASHATHTCRVI